MWSTGSFINLAMSKNVGLSKERPASVLFASLLPPTEASLVMTAAVFTVFGNFEDRVGQLVVLVAWNMAGSPDCDRMHGGNRERGCDGITTTSRGFGGTVGVAYWPLLQVERVVAHNTSRLVRTCCCRLEQRCLLFYEQMGRLQAVNANALARCSDLELESLLTAAYYQIRTFVRRVEREFWNVNAQPHVL